jgi:branched-chain amino acid transport system substrate-binding protein
MRKVFALAGLVALLVMASMPISFAQDDMERPLIGAWEACPDPTNLAGEIKIGVAFSLSEGASIYGVQQKEAVEMAVAEINESGYLGGATLAPVYEDALSSPEGATAAFTKLVEEDGVIAIIGPTLSSQAMAADPVALEQNVLVLAVSNTRTGMEADLGDYFFRVSLPEANVIPGTVAQAVEILGLESVAVMYGDDDDFTVSGYEVFIEALEANGVEVLIEETFTKGTTEFSSQLTNIIAEEPDAIVISALAAEATPILKQARGLGYEGPIIGGNGFNAPAIFGPDQAGEDGDGTIVGGAWNAALQNEISTDFTTRFEEMYGKAADQFAVQAYTGAWVLATALRCGDTTEAEGLKEAMGQIADFETPLGSFSFDEERLPAHEPVAQIVIDGQFVILSEESAAEVFGE